MKTQKRRVAEVLIGVLILLFSVGMMAGCTSASKDDSKLDESTLNVYTALEDDIIADYLETFKEQNPDVTVNITRDSTGIITAKLLAEKDNPQADVVWGTAASSLLVLKSNDMLEAYAPKDVDKVLKEFKGTDNPPTWVGIDAWETAFLVNKDVLKKKGITKIPKSYEDLLDPMYKGLITMPDPSASGTGLLTVNGLITLMGEDKAWEYLKKLDKNVAVYLQSGSAPAKDTAAGEYGIGISFGYRCVNSAAEMNGLGEVVFPSEGSGWDVEANALIKKDEGTKEISKKFLDWAISNEALAKYKENYPILSTGAGDSIPEGYTKDPMKQLIPGIDLQWCADNRDKILAEWTKQFSEKVLVEE
ncbi:MAG: extracellular solute-binding protein [Anaerovoracaceae bacterium]